MSFNFALKKHTSRLRVMNKIEVDFSMALIQSVMRSFNDTNLSRYLDDTFLIKDEKQTGLPPFTVVHICSTHLLCTVTRKLDVLSEDPILRSLAKTFISALIHCVSVHDAGVVFRQAVIVFTRFDQSKEIDDAIFQVKNRIGNNETVDSDNTWNR